MVNQDIIETKLDGLKELFEEKFKQNNKSHELLKEALSGKAAKWTEKALQVLMTGTAMWVLNQLLKLTQTVQAMFN